ncbi:hypothetical protein Dimus_022224 [Dionaea muscipula]
MGRTESPGVGIKIYTTTATATTSPPEATAPPPSTPRPALVSIDKTTLKRSKRRAVAKGVQKTLSKTSMLANFLPTGTLLAFEMVLPSIYRTGICTTVTTLMINLLLALCSVSCFFFHFTDSFRGPDGKVYYGLVTRKGLAVFKADLDVAVPTDDKYKISFTDFVHAFMSVLVFMAIALSDGRVTKCLFPRHELEVEEVMQSFPLMVAVLCSGLFLVFPTSRYACSNTRDKVNGWIILHRELDLWTRDTPSSNSKTKPSRTTSNSERHHQDLRKEKHDSGIRQDPKPRSAIQSIITKKTNFVKRGIKRGREIEELR